MKIIVGIKEMQQLALAARGAGTTIALVPTMGYLHEGHASLMREGRRRAGLLVVSIFVNPTQFGPGEDYTTYPRDMERDKKIAADCGVDVIFTPEASAMYPAGYQTFTEVERLTLPLCGAGRPGHFRGVTTVVGKLFNIIQPHAALFGKKDYQQLAVIRRMVADLNIPVEIVGMPIVRENDGLAMSSRNAYLSTGERESALCLSRSIHAAAALYREGQKDASILRERVMAVIGAEPSASVEYVDLRDGETLEEVKTADDRTLLALAVRIGRTRLIDNRILGEEN
ncbi:MAG TPA: pantoate--beta-alanine ligase [Geobacteraceae bacterium]|nr:pantoate--beta-alanine ligase [Geobacteraceae bacterium]